MDARMYAGVVLGVAAACSDPVPPETPKAKKESSYVAPERWAPPHPFALVTEPRLWIESGPHGRRYSVRNADGSTVAERIDEQELERGFPELFELYRVTEDGIGADGPLGLPDVDEPDADE